MKKMEQIIRYYTSILLYFFINFLFVNFINAKSDKRKEFLFNIFLMIYFDSFQLELNRIFIFQRMMKFLNSFFFYSNSIEMHQNI